MYTHTLLVSKGQLHEALYGRKLFRGLLETT